MNSKILANIMFGFSVNPSDHHGDSQLSRLTSQCIEIEAQT